MIGQIPRAWSRRSNRVAQYYFDLRAGETFSKDDDGIELLACRGGILADFTGGELDVLRPHGIGNVARRDRIGAHPKWVSAHP